MEEKRNKLLRYEAARWYARLQASDCTKSEREEFEQWFRSSPENANAYRQAEKLSSTLSAAAQSDPRFAELASAALAPGATANITRWRVAAMLLVGIAIATFGLVNRNSLDDAGVVVVNHINQSKQQQHYVLDDGSVVSLDVGSRFSFRMSKNRRSVELLAGRAYFEVVHDENRPFVVNAGVLQTTDVGTRFQVALATGNVSVTLVEGAVMVSDDSGSEMHETLRPGEQVLLKAGASTFEKHDVDASALTSWSTGRLVFKGTPLATVLDEVNRYSDCKIRLGDASLASIPIGGNFIAGGDSTQVIDALAAVLPLRVVHVGPNEIVLFQRDDS